MAAIPRPQKNGLKSNSFIIRRSWHAIPISSRPSRPRALASLPNAQRPVRYTRADGIPETEEDSAGQRPPVRDYLSINHIPSQVRVPKKIATPVRVEGKVWFANERNQVARNFAYLYALISVGVMVSPFSLPHEQYTDTVYQIRITKIRKRDPGHFEHLREKNIPIPGTDVYFFL
ncbi:hypothetical protein B0H16DRAFT_1580829 [Mycena metata]|uniref:Uncharacterized protein n=1 Tax=Mycena metata TaxID=1033252 RepID=A0AAD7I2Q0_9AGAR|nr:hypothetical protein B0H16DRAFT_1580829 [Mycena metata]